MISRFPPAVRASSWTRLAAGCLLLCTAGCTSAGGESEACTPDDQDGVVGGQSTILLSVSDTTFAVGGVGSGSTQRNITVQNKTRVGLTLTNVGSRPHSFVVECIASELPAGCPQTSCFPPEAEIPALEPGASKSVEFVAPVVEGAYPFTSTEPGDEGLLGQFVIN